MSRPSSFWTWVRRITALAPLLAVILIGSSAISQAYSSWDVGSNSWFDRLKGDGKQFQRGAAIPDHDVFGDKYTSVTYLEQGWTPADSMWFYTTTQGSDLLPYDLFMAAEVPGTSEPFHSNDNMNRYRYLTQKPTLSNPDGLPIGFVKNTYRGNDYLGFTCAACHTGQVNYNGTAIRIDGGPAGADNDTLLQDLARSLSAALDDANSRQRFVKKVMDRGHFSSEKDVVDTLTVYRQRLQLYAVVDRSSTRYGYARLDAFGRIYNRVLEHILDDRQLVDVMKDLVADGKWTQADYDAVLDKQHLSKVLSDEQRDQVIERVTQVLKLRAQLELRNRLFNHPTAPVSYPFLWDTAQSDYVQWNGLAANAGLGAVGRDTGEAIGVFGTLDWSERRGFSLTSLITGQGFKSTHVSFKSSINVRNLRRIEKHLTRLWSPVWPEDVLPKIDVQRKTRGGRLFKKSCAACHAEIVRDDPERRVVAHLSRLSDIGTDAQMAENSVNFSGLSGFLRNQYVGTGVGDVLIDERAPVASLLTKATFSVVATTDPADNFLTRGFEWLYNLGTAFFSNDIKPSIKHGDYDVDTTVDPFGSLRAYKARSLNGIWATAPYLHNGSVPTLYDLLLPTCDNVPAGSECRPPKFVVGSREFDPVKVGFKSSGYDGFEFNIIHVGNDNGGHEYGTELTRDDRLDLIEYLKSL